MKNTRKEETTTMHRRRVVGEILDESGLISDDRQEELVAALEAEAVLGASTQPHS